jgi:basic membrane lipoprotein Med (substrate-binding protein (PBP1-ABC) superfamily)
MKVINQVANKYKVIAQCATALSDELYDAKNFTRYSFMSSFQTSQIGRAAAHYYSQRKKGTSPWQSGVYLSLTCRYH